MNREYGSSTATLASMPSKASLTSVRAARFCSVLQMVIEQTAALVGENFLDTFEAARAELGASAAEDDALRDEYLATAAAVEIGAAQL